MSPLCPDRAARLGALLLACLAAACSTGGVLPDAVPAATTRTDDAPTGVAVPEAWSFTFEQTVTAAGRQWTLGAAGRYAGGNVSCRVRASGPGVSVDRQLLRVEERLWVRDQGSGAPDLIPSEEPADRALLDFCPAWPPRPEAAGLVATAAGEPARHELNGREALGYRADAAALEEAWGASLRAVQVEAFNFWIAEEGGWLLEVNLTASGPGADLASLLGPLPVPEGTARLHLRHRLDPGAAPTPATPPG